MLEQEEVCLVSLVSSDIHVHFMLYPMLQVRRLDAYIQRYTVQCVFFVISTQTRRLYSEIYSTVCFLCYRYADKAVIFRDIQYSLFSLL